MRMFLESRLSCETVSVNKVLLVLVNFELLKSLNKFVCSVSEMIVPFNQSIKNKTIFCSLFFYFSGTFTFQELKGNLGL